MKLFGIVLNWKGLKEENYLYTEEELKRFDNELYDDCITKPNEWHSSAKASCAWKTWEGILINSEEMLEKFLSGGFNDLERMEVDEDWYWDNIERNDLYGYASDTMQNALEKLNAEVTL